MARQPIHRFAKESVSPELNQEHLKSILGEEGLDDVAAGREASLLGSRRGLTKGEPSTNAWPMTLLLRPVLVVTDAHFATLREEVLEFGAFVHVDDVATAVIAALSRALARHTHHPLSGLPELVGI